MASIFEGPTDIPLTDKTLYQRLVDRVSDKPDHLAVISDHEGVSITVKQLLEDVVKLVSGLMSQLGLSRDDNMAIWSRNCYYYVVFQYAVSALGLTLWLFDPNWTARELESALILSDATVLVLPGQGSPQNDKFHYIRVLDQVERKNVKLTYIVTIDGRNYDQSAHFSYIQCSINQLQSGQHSVTDHELDSKRPYLGLFTSGSTGQPKAVVHSQFAILNNRVMQASKFYKSEILRYCVPITLHHAFGSLAIVPQIAVSGLTMVLTGYTYSVSGFMKCMLKYECSSLAAVPTMTFDAINYLSQQPEMRLTHWSTLLSGGAALPEGTVQTLQKLVPSLTTVLMSYALSEMGPVTSWRNTDGANCSHLGTMVGHVSVKLENEMTKETVPIGQPGVIKVRSPFRMIGYHKDKPLTDQLFDQEGWFNTGDMGRFDQDGHLYFVGRAKEIISRGGEKFHPSETEQVLHMLQDVSECAVVPVPDDRLGQLALGFVKIAEGSQLTAHDVKAFMKQKLTPYKIPEHIVLTREALFKTGSGKISRLKLQKLAFDYLDNIRNNNANSYVVTALNHG